MIHRVRYSATLVTLLFVAASPTVAEETVAEEKAAPLRIVFLGDSITAAGGYIKIIGADLAKKKPDSPPVVINRGRSSETVSGLSEAYHPGRRPNVHTRLQKELKNTKPDWVVACYGMNCGIYHPLSEERFAAYKRGMEDLIKKVHNSGSRLVLLTPPPYAKPIPKFPAGSNAKARAAIMVQANAKAEVEAKKNARRFGYRSAYVYYDQVLARYSAWLLTLAARENVWVVDLRSAMLPAGKAAYAGDGIHPNRKGHQIMAASFLEHWPKIAAEGEKTPKPKAAKK